MSRPMSAAADNHCSHAGRLYRYHGGGNLVLASGIAGGFVLSGFGWLPALAGFFAVSAPVFLLTALAYTVDED